VDQILPRPNPFRQRLTEKYGTNWAKVDYMKIFTSSSMQAFQWRSTHNKLYGRSDLLRFDYVLDPKCHFCGDLKQNIEHVYLHCPRIQGLFANFHRQYKINPELSEVEMLAGADSDNSRTKVTLKRLGILRKYIYGCIYSGAMPKWEDVLTCIDKAYVIEYAIGDANGHVLKVLKEWEL
jgi:hypothetical protein